MNYYGHKAVMARNRAASAANQAKEGEWQVVCRKRPYPTHWRPVVSVAALTTRTKPYIPFQTQPTYAQVVASTKTTPTTSPDTSPTSSPTAPNPTTRQPTYYVSPHNPTSLRFPPSHRFTEWRGRCFKCCREGHNAARCHNPKKCGRCWQDGHTGNRCKSTALNPAALLFQPAQRGNTNKPANKESGF